MISTIEYQGYTIKAPLSPLDQGGFTVSPTDMQVVSQVDNTFVVDGDSGDENVLVFGTLTFQCRWVCIFSVMAQQAVETQSISITSGVTTTDSDTKTMALGLGISGEAPGEILTKVGVTLSASFSQSETHSVALSAARTFTQAFSAQPGTTLQVWQLHSEYIAEYSHGGQDYRYVLCNDGDPGNSPILELTFPEQAGG
jgi:hypothetical protein